MTQSGNAVTFIAAALRSAGLLATRRLIPLLAAANVGTSGLVLVASFDLRLAALWLLALCGVLTYFGLDGSGRMRPLLGAVTGLGLMLLGLALVKAGAEPLRGMEAVQGLLAWGARGVAGLFLLGALVTLLAQSSSTIAILLIMLHGAGLIGFEQAAAGVCGAGAGSALSVLLLGARLAGSARQAVLAQAGLRGAGALLVLALLAIEQAGVPLLLGALRALAEGPAMQLALLFLAQQLLVALIAAPLHGPLAALLARLAPEGEAEAEGRPRHLFPQALEEPASALPLLRAEQARLVERLPALLDPLREEGARRAAPAAGSAALEAAIGRFLAALLARELPRPCWPRRCGCRRVSAISPRCARRWRSSSPSLGRCARARSASASPPWPRRCSCCSRSCARRRSPRPPPGSRSSRPIAAR